MCTSQEIALDTSQLLSLSDDEDEDEEEQEKGRGTLLSNQQFEDLKTKGYCSMVSDETDNKLLVNFICGYCRENYRGQGIVTAIKDAIVYFVGPVYDTEQYVKVQSGGEEPMYFLTKRANIELSGLLTSFSDASDSVECKEVPGETLEHVLTYLGHHKGIEPGM